MTRLVVPFNASTRAPQPPVTTGMQLETRPGQTALQCQARTSSSCRAGCQSMQMRTSTYAHAHACTYTDRSMRRRTHAMCALARTVGGVFVDRPRLTVRACRPALARRACSHSAPCAIQRILHVYILGFRSVGGSPRESALWSLVGFVSEMRRNV